MLHTPAPIVAATTGGVWRDIKSAFSDGVGGALDIVLGCIRFVLMLLPIVLIFGVPGWFLFKRLRPHLVWERKAVTPQQENS